MVVRNPNLPVPSRAGGLATTVRPDLPVPSRAGGLATTVRPDLPIGGGRTTLVGPGKGND